jgi:hypothetical protein
VLESVSMHVSLKVVAFLSKIIPDLLVQFKRSILLLLSGQVGVLSGVGRNLVLGPSSRLLITAKQRVYRCRVKALTLNGAAAKVPLIDVIDASSGTHSSGVITCSIARCLIVQSFLAVGFPRSAQLCGCFVRVF